MLAISGWPCLGGAGQKSSGLGLEHDSLIFCHLEQPDPEGRQLRKAVAQLAQPVARFSRHEKLLCVAYNLRVFLTLNLKMHPEPQTTPASLVLAEKMFEGENYLRATWLLGALGV